MKIKRKYSVNLYLKIAVTSFIASVSLSAFAQTRTKAERPIEASNSFQHGLLTKNEKQDKKSKSLTVIPKSNSDVSPSEKSLYFEFGSNWKARIQKSAKGGGSVDGGGGNVSGGSLLDRLTNSYQQGLDSKKLKSLVMDTYKLRLQKLDLENRGFLSWLTAGFEINWISDEKDFDENLCKNKQIYGVEQKIVACQTLTSVHISKHWLDNQNTTDQDIADIVIHELIRYHVIRLGKISDLNLESQDALTSETTFKILSEEFAPDFIFKDLVKIGLLPDALEVETTRLNNRAQIFNLLSDLIENRLLWVIKTCQRQGSESLKIELNQFFKNSLNDQKLLSYSCRKWQDPMLTEEDPSCSIKDEQANAIYLFEKNCGKLQ